MSSETKFTLENDARTSNCGAAMKPTESAPISEDLKRLYEDARKYSCRWLRDLIERVAQLEAAVAELRAINERLVLDVKRCTEENERLQAQIYHE